MVSETVHFLACNGKGESIDKPKLTKLAAELLPPLQENKNADESVSFHTDVFSKGINMVFSGK